VAGESIRGELLVVGFYSVGGLPFFCWSEVFCSNDGAIEGGGCGAKCGVDGVVELSVVSFGVFELASFAVDCPSHLMESRGGDDALIGACEEVAFLWLFPILGFSALLACPDPVVHGRILVPDPMFFFPVFLPFVFFQ